MPHTNHLRLHRRKWALSQEHVAQLLGLKARSVISRYERGLGLPPFRCAFGLQLLFGVPIQDLFPELTQSICDDVMRQAIRLDEAVRDKEDPTSLRQLAFLRDLVDRAAGDPSAV